MQDEVVRGRVSWLKLLATTLIVYLLFHQLATALGSVRGEAGIIVGALVVAALLAAERFLFKVPILAAARALGFRRPALPGLAAAVAVSILLLAPLALFFRMSNTSIVVLPGWLALLPGLFAQGGIAEESLFRGFLFRRVRTGRTFWRAAWLSLLPFVAVHLVMFFTFPWPVALAAVLLAAAVSFPLAHLFELNGGAVWAPAIVHFTMQSALKVVDVSGEMASKTPIVWMAASAIIPFGVFLIGRPTSPVAIDPAPS